MSPRHKAGAIYASVAVLALAWTYRTLVGNDTLQQPASDSLATRRDRVEGLDVLHKHQGKIESEHADRKSLVTRIPSRDTRATMADASVSADLSAQEIYESIDWSLIRPRDPIPRQMPTAQADGPIEAGFAPEWIRASIGAWNLAGTSTSLVALPTLLEIASNAKDPGDPWAYGVEDELWQLVRQELPQAPEMVTRVFCNAHGCLCYFEGDFRALAVEPLTVVHGALSRDEFRSYTISPDDGFVTNGAQWRLLTILRTHTQKANTAGH